MHKKNIATAGKRLEEAEKVLIMVHGRGANAQDILGVSEYLNVDGYALLAPQATNNTWYPYSFLAPPAQNEPWLTSAVSLITELLQDVKSAGISSENIYLLGFSQGACLTLEAVSREAQRLGGVVAFTGGLIGDKLYEENYTGDFSQTPVFIGTSDPDPHVPVERVQQSAELLKKLNAQVTSKIYKNMGHTISDDEVRLVNELIFT